MAKVMVKTNFSNEFQGILKTNQGEFPIGGKDGELRPYDMLLGGLASCLYATFLGIADKKKLTFQSVEIQVEGEKREEVPTWLTVVEVVFYVKGASPDKEKEFLKAVELSGKYCSIYQTLSHVAEMKTVLKMME